MQEGSLLICVEDVMPPVVRASGELDNGNCAEFESILQNTLGSHDTVILALDGITFVDSCGVRVLIKAAVSADENGRELRIASMTPHLDHVLTVSGFRDLFGIEAVREVVPETARPSRAEDYCFEVPGTPDTCRRVRKNVAVFAREMGFDATAVDDIKLAVGEAVSNAVRHGSVCSDDSIQVLCQNHGGTLQVTLRYPSKSFDPDSIPTPTYSSAPEGGMGIYFMKLVMDNVSYEFQDGFTSVTLEKRLPDLRPRPI